jgi:glutamine amidotransferase
MIIVVDYGASNIRSVTKALEAVGGQAVVSSDYKKVGQADKIVLPGVGAFGKAAEALEVKGLTESLIQKIKEGIPFLGICLGLQLLFTKSDENPDDRGLSLIQGKVVRFPSGLRVPHLGWNQVHQKGNSRLWKDIPDGEFFYFAHSYVVQSEAEETTAGITTYGISFISAISENSLWGTQFHPEKSQKWGLQMLRNFVQL